MNYKRKKRKIKTVNGYLPGDGPRGNSKKDQTKKETIADLKEKEWTYDDVPRPEYGWTLERLGYTE